MMFSGSRCLIPCRLAGLVFVAVLFSGAAAYAAPIPTTVEKTGDTLTVATPAGGFGKFALTVNTDGTEFRVTSLDPLSTVFTPKGDCKDVSTVTESVALCRVEPYTPYVDKLTITTADKNDDVRVNLDSYRYTRSGALDHVQVDLGAGNDTLDGSKTQVVPFIVTPGLGEDTVIGGGADGDKFIADAVPDGADTFTDQNGQAEVSYAKRTTSVNVTLDGKANDGDPNMLMPENDNIRESISKVVGGGGDDMIDVSLLGDAVYLPPGVEVVSRDAEGGPGKDTLTDQSTPSDTRYYVGGTLDGGPGEDTLIGTGGIYYGYDGGYTLLGGADNDTMTVSIGDLWGAKYVLDGGAGNDTMTVTSKARNWHAVQTSLLGGSGDDTMTSLSGDTVFAGGDGADTMTGNDGNDTYCLAGVTGVADGVDTVVDKGVSRADRADHVSYSNSDLCSDSGEVSRTAAVQITSDNIANDGSLGEGDNIGNSVESIHGGDGNDVLAGGGSVTAVSGAGGNDTISAAEKEYGDGGNDTLTAQATGSTLDGGADNDTLIGGSGDDSLLDDVDSVGSNSDDVIAGNGGEDFIKTGRAKTNDTVTGGPGKDHFVISDNSMKQNIDGGPDDDRFDVSAYSWENTISGGDGNDKSLIVGRYTFYSVRTYGNRYYGGNGDDTMQAFGDDDTISGGDGNDLLTGRSVQGGFGDDQLYGLDTLDSQSASCDVNYHASKDDQLSGGDGNDRLIGGYGDDQLDGGEGDDQLAAGPVKCGVDPATADLAANDSQQDALRGSGGNDTFVASMNDAVAGGDGDDAIVIKRTERFDTSSGFADVFGNDGIDTVSYSSQPRESLCGVTVSLDDVPNDNFSPSGSYDPRQNVHSDIENLTGSQCGDTLIGSNAANVIRGGDVSSVFNSSGFDQITGGAGQDVLSAGAGAYAKIASRDGEVDNVACAGPGLEPGGSVIGDQSDEITGCKSVELVKVADPVTGKPTPGVDAPKLDCKVTNLLGVDYKRAVYDLKRNQCVAKLTFWWVASKKNDGKVLKQNAKPGNYGTGSDVGLTVGKKATVKWCRVPRLIGKTYTSVSKMLKNQQCNVVFRYKNVKKKGQYKRVISQSKRGNVRAGSTLYVTIGWKK